MKIENDDLLATFRGAGACHFCGIFCRVRPSTLLAPGERNPRATA